MLHLISYLCTQEFCYFRAQDSRINLQECTSISTAVNFCTSSTMHWQLAFYYTGYMRDMPMPLPFFQQIRLRAMPSLVTRLLKRCKHASDHSHHMKHLHKPRSYYLGRTYLVHGIQPQLTKWCTTPVNGTLNMSWLLTCHLALLCYLHLP